MEEIWKIIEDYPNYEISTYGNIRSIDRDYIDTWGRLYHKKGQLIKQQIQISKGNYTQVMVNLLKGHEYHRLIVSRLVAKTFIPNPNNFPQVNHIDEDSTNNNVNNLEWCTCQYNVTYGTYMERRSKANSKSIDVYDINGNFIETLNSGIEVSEKYGVSRGFISSVCNGSKKSAKNYIFKFHSN